MAQRRTLKREREIKAKIRAAFSPPSERDPYEGVARGYFMLGQVWVRNSYSGGGYAPRGTVFAVESVNVLRDRPGYGLVIELKVYGIDPAGRVHQGGISTLSDMVPLYAIRDRKQDGMGGLWWSEIELRARKLAHDIGWPFSALMAKRFDDVLVSGGARSLMDAFGSVFGGRRF